MPLIETKKYIQMPMNLTDFALRGFVGVRRIQKPVDINLSPHPVNIYLLDLGDTHGKQFSLWFMLDDLTHHYLVSVLDDSLR